MPKYHNKLHDINSPIDHFKINGLYDLEKGLGLVTSATKDKRLEITTDPAVAPNNQVIALFDATIANNVILSVDDTGIITFSRDSVAVPPVGTRDIQGRFDPARVDPITLLPAPDNVWWIDIDGNASFDGNVTIGGAIIGPGIVDHLDELLDPATGGPHTQPPWQAFQKSMKLWDDGDILLGGTINAFWMDQAGKLVEIGDPVSQAYELLLYGNQSIVGDLVVPGTPFLQIDGGGVLSDAVSIINTNATKNDILASNWRASQTGQISAKRLVVNSTATAFIDSITNYYDGGGDKGIIIQNQNSSTSVADDIVGRYENSVTIMWRIRSDGSAFFQNSDAVVPAVDNHVLTLLAKAGSAKNGINLTNNGTGDAIVISQVGAAADVISLTSAATGATNAIINISNASATYDILGNAGNWWTLPDGHIETLENVFANTGRVETPELRFDGALLILANLAGDVTARTTDGSFVFDIVNAANKEVIPSDDALTDFGSPTNRWANMYAEAVYTNYLYDIWEIHGDGTTPHGTFLISSDNQKFQLSSGTEDFYMQDSGRTIFGNSLILDEIERIKNVSGSDITLEFVSANDIALNMSAGQGIVPTADNSLKLGADGFIFANAWLKQLRGTTLISSQTTAAGWQNMLIKCGDVAGDATTMTFETGNGGAIFDLNGGSALMPQSSGANDLGGTVNRWQDLFMAGNINYVNDTIWGANNITLNIRSQGTGDIAMIPSGGEVRVTGDLVPSSDATYSLGSATPDLGWLNIYVRNVIGTSPLNVKCDSDPMSILTTAVTGGWARGAGTAHININAWDDLNIDVGGDTAFNTEGAALITADGTMGLGGTVTTITSTTGGISLDAFNDIVDFNGATITNAVLPGLGLDVPNSFCLSVGLVVQGLKEQTITLDCSQPAARNVTLTFGNTTNKSIVYNNTSGQFDIGAGVVAAGTSQITGNLTVTGDLTVNGTQTIINTDVIQAEDPVMELNSGSIAPTYGKMGIQVGRPPLPGPVNQDDAGLFFVESAGRWYCGIGDETDPVGPGVLEEIITTHLSQTLYNKTLITPTIASFINANHTHAGVGASGGQIDHANLLNKGTNTHAAIDLHLGYIANVHGASGNVLGDSSNATIVGNWTFATGEVILPLTSGVTAPSGSGFTIAGETAAEGKVFWHTTEDTLYVGKDGSIFEKIASGGYVNPYHAQDYQEIGWGRKATLNTGDALFFGMGEQIEKVMMHDGYVRGVSLKTTGASTWTMRISINGTTNLDISVSAVDSFFQSNYSLQYDAGDIMTVEILTSTGTVKEPSVSMLLENTSIVP